jgi:hypothetical protein
MRDCKLSVCEKEDISSGLGLEIRGNWNSIKEEKEKCLDVFLKMYNIYYCRIFFEQIK